VSEARVTASAWVVFEPPGFRLAGHELEASKAVWKLRAEVSVSDEAGEPAVGLTASAWSIHVTDALGTSYAPAFGVSKVVASGRQVPGFYLLTVPELQTPLWISPTAFGIAVAGTAGKPKRELSGQVVVPVRVQGPTIHPALTFVPIT
jgi:hypothetical protein